MCVLDVMRPYIWFKSNDLIPWYLISSHAPDPNAHLLIKYYEVPTLSKILKSLKYIYVDDQSCVVWRLLIIHTILGPNIIL